MPYAVKRTPQGCLTVFNKKNGKIKSKCTTKAKARKQIRFLKAYDHRAGN